LIFHRSEDYYTGIVSREEALKTNRAMYEDIQNAKRDENCTFDSFAFEKVLRNKVMIVFLPKTFERCVFPVRC